MKAKLTFFAFLTSLGLAVGAPPQPVTGASITITTADAVRVLPLKPGQPRLYDSNPLREIEQVSPALKAFQFTSIPQRIQDSYEVRATKPGYLYVFGGTKNAAPETIFGGEAGKWEPAEGAIGGKNVAFCFRRKVNAGEEISLKAFELQLAAASIATPGAPAPQTASAAASDDPIVGRWKVGQNIWVLSANGHAARSRPGFREQGQWKCTGTGTPPTYEFNWGGGREVESLHLSTQRDKLLGKGNTVVGERARE
jgi:hypothetical protein